MQSNGKDKFAAGTTESLAVCNSECELRPELQVKCCIVGCHSAHVCSVAKLVYRLLVALQHVEAWQLTD